MSWWSVVCVLTTTRGSSEEEKFCFDVLRDDVEAKAAIHCGQCSVAEARGLAWVGLAKAIDQGEAAVAAMRSVFEEGLVDHETFRRDGIHRSKTAQLAADASSLLEGRLPNQTKECAATREAPENAIRGACPLSRAYASIGDVVDWHRLGEIFSEDEYYELAAASFFRSNSSHQLASIFAAWGHTELALRVYGGIVARKRLDGDEARATRLEAAIASVPPVVPADPREFRIELRSRLRAVGRLEDTARLGRTLFHLAHHGLSDREDQEVLAETLPGFAPLPSESGRSTSRLRIGFVSAYLSDHSVGKMLAEVVALLAERFDVSVFRLSSRRSDDQVRRYVDDRVGASVELNGLNVFDARRRIAAANMDVLVFADVGMEPFSVSLASSRLARVQCAWWGHPVTTGSKSVDYFLSLDTEIDDAYEEYTEQLVRLDAVNTAPFAQVLDLSVNASRAHLVEEPDPGGALYLVLGRLFKLHPDFDAALLDILSRDPTGVVVLVAEAQRPVTRRLWRRLETYGKNLDRLRIVDYWNYVDALSLATVVLDTFPYGGCLTALDAVSNSKPFVTLPSHLLRGRFASSIYRQMGFSDLVAQNRSHFVDLALRVARDSDFRQFAVDNIRRAYPRLHRPAQVADEWARLFLGMNRTTTTTLS